MSIVQVWLTADRALIGVDTEVEQRGHGYADGAKLHVIPHLNSVLVGRGSAVFISSLYAAVCGSFWDFDAATKRLKELAAMTFNQLMATAAAHGIDDTRAFDHISALLVGWSPKCEAFSGVEVEQFKREDGFVIKNVGQRYAAPWHYTLDKYSDPSTPESMIAIAAAQVKLIREQYPTHAAGGGLIVAELTRDSTLISRVCELTSARTAPDPETCRRADEKAR